MNFYLLMHNENLQHESAKQMTVADDGAETVVAMDDGSNFLNYQFDQKDSDAGKPKSIPPEQQPTPKKLKDAISKRTDTPAIRYMSIIAKSRENTML